MKRLIPVALLTALLAGCAHDSPCVPVYDDQGRLVHTNTCMKGTTQDNWETAGAIAGGAAAVAGLPKSAFSSTRIFGFWAFVFAQKMPELPGMLDILLR